MSLVADFSVPADAFCLGDTLATCPDATVELDRLVAHSPEYVMPFVWALDTEQEAFEAALADDPTVVTADVADSFDGASLYQFTWADVVSERLHVILDHDGVVLEACGNRSEWRLWVRFGDREHFSTFRDHFQQFGAITLNELTTPQTPGGAQYGLTEKQRTALLTAADAGYYDTPSGATGEEIAEELGITQQSFSRRVRRAVTTLIENTIGRQRDD